MAKPERRAPSWVAPLVAGGALVGSVLTGFSAYYADITADNDRVLAESLRDSDDAYRAGQYEHFASAEESIRDGYMVIGGGFGLTAVAACVVALRNRRHSQVPDVPPPPSSPLPG